MFNFYESLETLKSVKIPSWKEIWTTTLVILAVILVMGLFFMVVDGFMVQLYQNFYHQMHR